MYLQHWACTVGFHSPLHLTPPASRALLFHQIVLAWDKTGLIKTHLHELSNNNTATSNTFTSWFLFPWFQSADQHVVEKSFIRCWKRTSLPNVHYNEKSTYNKTILFNRSFAIYTIIFKQQLYIKWQLWVLIFFLKAHRYVTLKTSMSAHSVDTKN